MKENETGGACSTHVRDKFRQQYCPTPEGRGPLVGPRRGWKDIIKTDLRETGEYRIDSAESKNMTFLENLSFS
jgi:hypothetical protein